MKIHTKIQALGRTYYAPIYVDKEASYEVCNIKYYFTLSQLLIEHWEYFLPKVSKEISLQLSKIFINMGFEELTFEKDGECAFLVDNIKLTYEEFEEVVEQLVSIIKEVVK